MSHHAFILFSHPTKLNETLHFNNSVGYNINVYITRRYGSDLLLETQWPAAEQPGVRVVLRLLSFWWHRLLSVLKVCQTCKKCLTVHMLFVGSAQVESQKKMGNQFMVYGSFWVCSWSKENLLLVHLKTGVKL